MADVLLTFEDVYALPEPSIQTYLQAKGWSSQNFLADRISAIVFLADDNWLHDADRALVRLEDFAITAGFSDEELITQVQEAGQEVTVLMTRFDLVRLLVKIEVGDLYSFGNNTYGQLGLNDTNYRDVPTLVTALAGLKVKIISGGGSHTAIITNVGNLYSFGSNTFGELGLGDNTNKNIPTLVTVPDDLKVKLVSCGVYHTVIIAEDGNLYSFGDNIYGQLGLGNNTNTNIPTLVTVQDDLKVKVVSCGKLHTVIIAEDGNLYSFGDNSSGQLGLGDDTFEENLPTLVTIPGGLKVKMVSCGDSHTVIITEDDNFYSFGNNVAGQLGLGDNTRRNVPELVNVPDGLKVKAISCGHLHTAIITEDDKLYSFGGNRFGQLGLGYNINRRIPTLVTVSDNLKVKAVSSGFYHTTIITEDDNLYTFGHNNYGQLGLGETRKRNRPTLVSILGASRVIAINCGEKHTMVIAK